MRWQRPLRVELEDGLYHVIVRGNDRRSVFRDGADGRRYLGRLAFYAEKQKKWVSLVRWYVETPWGIGLGLAEVR